MCDLITPDRRQSKTLILLTNVGQKEFKTEFSNAIRRQTGDSWQLKTLFLAIFYLPLSIVQSIFDFRISHVLISANKQSG